MRDKYHSERPILALTMGDVAGVGPEIVVKALAEDVVFDWCRPVVVGDPGAADQALKLVGADLSVTTIEQTREPSGRSGTMELVPVSRMSSVDLAPGRPGQAGGLAAARFIETGAEMVMSGKAHGLVTAPISKEALNKAGYNFPGHTEFLAHLAGGARVVMMLAGATLKVALVTIHVAFKDVPALITREKIVSTAVITHQSLQRFFGLARPRLAAAALNPHAGEGGLFGREEETLIAPAVAECQKQGLDLKGPFPADTLFYRAVQGEFDAVVCMYHDQGLIPFKLLHFKDGVNVTLGLPFIRTSVDHGTAYDLAGQGRADHHSLLAAIKMAAEMARSARSQNEAKTTMG